MDFGEHISCRNYFMVRGDLDDGYTNPSFLNIKISSSEVLLFDDAYGTCMVAVHGSWQIGCGRLGNDGALPNGEPDRMHFRRFDG
jgi:hypothetical protein